VVGHIGQPVCFILGKGGNQGQRRDRGAANAGTGLRRCLRNRVLLATLYS
jgi:hypothetical protein